MSNNNDNTNTTTTTAVPMGSPADNDTMKIKQGHSFLFCLCDMRRTVLILDILGMIGTLIVLLFVILVDQYGSPEDKESVFGSPEDNQALYSFWAMIGIYSAMAACHLCGVLGAATFSICPILITIVMHLVYAVLAGVSKNWIGLGVYLFLLYPHVVLCNELARGVMTRENYRRRESQCCCC